MPELPEVEAARRALEENCVGKKIRKCIVADDPKVIDGAHADFEASLAGKTIVAARRKGKNMWLQLDSPPFPSFQFGMAGAIYIKGVAVTKYRRSAVNDTDEWPSKYSKVFIELNDGLEFSFTDKRRFAKVRLLKDPTSVPPISELGPDALLEPMDVDEFIESLSKKKMAIKALLLDQSYIAGIGNWIVDEVLYQARIHPLQIASSLTRENCESLHKCIKEVIDKAVEVGADSSQFPNDWIFHYREKRPGKAFVDGRKIEFITAGGRTSAFVPELQKLTGNQLGRSSSGKSRKKSVEGLDKNENEMESKSEENPTKGRPKSKSAAKRKVKTSGSEDDEGPDKNEDEEESKSEEKTSRGGPMSKFAAKSKVKTDGSEDDEGKLLKKGQMKKSKTIADDGSEHPLKGKITRNETTKRVATLKKTTTKTSPASGQQRKRSK